VSKPRAPQASGTNSAAAITGTCATTHHPPRAAKLLGSTGKFVEVPVVHGVADPQALGNEGQPPKEAAAVGFRIARGELCGLGIRHRLLAGLDLEALRPRSHPHAVAAEVVEQVHGEEVVVVLVLPRV